MYRKAFACLSRRTLSSIHTIFTTVHSISDMNNICKFHDISRIFKRFRAWTDGRSDRKTECINTFQLFWKVLIMFWKKHYSIKNTLPIISRHRTYRIHNLLWDPVHEMLKLLIPFFTENTFLHIWMTRDNFILFSSIQTYYNGLL